MYICTLCTFVLLQFDIQSPFSNLNVYLDLIAMF